MSGSNFSGDRHKMGTRAMRCKASLRHTPVAYAVDAACSMLLATLRPNSEKASLSVGPLKFWLGFWRGHRKTDNVSFAVTS